MSFESFQKVFETLGVLLDHHLLDHALNDVHDGRGQRLPTAAAVRLVRPLHQFTLHTTNLCALFAHTFTS